MLVRFDRDNGRFEDDEFNKFCAEQNIVRIEKEFINSNGEIYYSFFVEYHSRKTLQGKPNLDGLNELERAQYEKLRNWRNDIASSEGIPAYVLMYNNQLYDIVQKQPRSKSDLAAIKGMKQKAEKYSEDVIRILQEVELDRQE
jgi:superfamily II DNA helicase RecQ